MATGTYIAYLDADDFIDSSMYCSLLEIMTKEKADLVIGGHALEKSKGVFEPYYRDDNQENKICIFYTEDMIGNLLANRYYTCSANTCLFKTEIIRNIKWDETITHYEDLLYLYEVMRLCKKAVYTSKVYYYYCFNERSASRGKFNKKMMTMIDVCERITPQIEREYPGLAKEVKREFVRNNIMCAMNAAKSDYKNKADCERMRRNVKKNIIFYLQSSVSLGYKLYALLLSMNWTFFARIRKIMDRKERI